MQTGLIEKIEVRDLFGQFSYTIPHEGKLVNPAIFYGDNGVGKSTLLNLVFHLLSSSNERGHRNELWQTKFSYLSASLSNGFKLSAERRGGLDSEEVVFAIYQDEVLKVEWPFNGPNLGDRMPDREMMGTLLSRHKFSQSLLTAWMSETNEETSDGVERSHASYIIALEHCAPNIFFVSAERRLASDSISDPIVDFDADELQLDRHLRRIKDVVKDSRQAALKQALAKASRWVRDSALRSATQGSMNVHNVYEQILKQLSIDYGPTVESSEKSQFSQTLEKLESIESRSESYSKYDLTSAVDMSEFRKSIGEDRVEGREISAKLIDPYVKSVLGRLDALQEIYAILDRFVQTINTFLTRKKLHFSMREGFQIVNDQSASLQPDQLSSGEQQLLLMFCYALTAQDQASVFIIDEPEISLNVKWQRQLLRALIEISDTSKTQFIFASHSMELIAQHRSSVVELGREK